MRTAIGILMEALNAPLRGLLSLTVFRPSDLVLALRASMLTPARSSCSRHQGMPLLVSCDPCPLYGHRTNSSSLSRMAIAESETPNCWASDTRFWLLKRVHRARASSRSPDSFGA